MLPFGEAHIDGAEQKKLLNGLSAATELADGTYKIFLGDGSFYGLGLAQDGRFKVKTKLC